ncbi:carbohydrate kinase family protein [Mesoaciditoga lauensis]|uniref:carbohydrate kinase family protein n=1 Tax=Mesoaciditoga lauensis TaxID=1495039 RepID=UPI00068A44F7|nr:carbohydrate kinase family protein [Mesoaciditoga lauensis]
MRKIIVAGHLCLDIIPTWKNGKWEELLPGNLIITEGLKFSTGGCVSNTGISLKKLGMDPILIGKIGDDEIGKLITNIIESNGKNLSNHLVVGPNIHSSYTIVLSPPDADRSFLHYPGANDAFAANDIKFGDLKDSKIFHFGYPTLMKRMRENDGEELVRVFDEAHDFKMVTSMDITMPDPFSDSSVRDWQRLLKNVLPHTDIFFPSVRELFYMLDIELPFTVKKLRLASKKLIQWGTKMVVIKLGESGLYFRSGKLSDPLAKLIGERWSEKELLVPAFKVKVKGTTGAGDASIAGFLTGLVEEMGPLKTLAIASATGAFCVEEIDSISGIKPLSTVLERIERGWELITPQLKIDNWERGDYGVFIGSYD